MVPTIKAPCYQENLWIQSSVQCIITMSTDPVSTGGQEAGAGMSISPLGERGQVLHQALFVVEGYSGQGEDSSSEDHLVVQGNAAGPPVCNCSQTSFPSQSQPLQGKSSLRVIINTYLLTITVVPQARFAKPDLTILSYIILVKHFHQVNIYLFSFIFRVQGNVTGRTGWTLVTRVSAH